jgi:hypothetical protein
MQYRTATMRHNSQSVHSGCATMHTLQWELPGGGWGTWGRTSPVQLATPISIFL